ncbi:MFS transporter [Nocardioides jishulii]|uniref:MFS transporter n=2 Tax=Nocardioides jishulii TaxID=2575440 RepID=A0A4U2YTQ1_9ACTN|nr:MFS transporter [Nocardioides jishulii]TKI64857.1 MFS transporter [Nocardioides jishulii]
MLPVLLVSVDNTALSFAVPSLARDLRPSGTQLLWIVDAYPLVLAGLLVAMGSVGDRIGRRRLLLIGAVGFAAVSGAAAFAPSAEWLIAARAALGFFGAMLMPATLSLLRNIFVDADERRKAIAIWASGFSGGAALGPIVGGWLLEHYEWGSIFLMAVPVLVPLLVLGPLLLPESKDPDPGPVDPVGIALAVLALGGLVFAVKAAGAGDSVGVVAVAALVGLGSGVAFVKRMLARPQPMLDVRLFSNRVFSGALATNLVAVFAFVGFIYFLSQHLQLVAGYSPMTAGWLMVPGLVVTIVCGLLAVRLVRRLTAAQVVVIGLLLNSAGYAVVALLGSEGSLVALLVGFVILSAGVGLAETISNDLALSAVPVEKAGAASAVSETAYEVGAVLGVAVLGSLLNMAFRTGVEVPAQLPADQASLAGETLAGAVEVAESWPGAVGEALLHSASTAFDHGVLLTSGLGVLLTAAMALVARRALR